MKKFTSIILTFAMVLTLVIPMATASAAESLSARTNAVDLRVGVLNDTHILGDGRGAAKAKAAVAAIKTVGTNQLDGLILVGDNANYETNDDPTTNVATYTQLYNAIANGGLQKSDIFAYAMGNHEFPLNNTNPTVSQNAIKTFEEQSGFSMNHHVVKNGIHFVVGGADNYQGEVSSETEAYLMKEIDSAIAEDSTNSTENSDGTYTFNGVPNSEKPVFLLLHHPMGETLYQGANGKYSAEFLEYLKTRPQVINITAHMHRLAQFPQNIWQDGFTAYQSPMVSIGNHGYFDAVEEDSIGDGVCSQGSMIEVKDNVVSILRLDYTNNEYIGEPFVIDIPAIVRGLTDADTTNNGDAYNYTEEKRAAVTSTAAFPEGAEITVMASSNSATVTFPNNAEMTTFDAVQQDYFVRGYKLELITKADQEVAFTANYQADFWKSEANRAANYSKTVTGLAPETDYIAKVYPRTPLGAFGEPITTEFTTPAFAIEDGAVRFEFEDYCPDSKIVKESKYASGGGLVASTYSSELGSNTISRPADGTTPYTFTFDIEIPYDDGYKVEYAIGNVGAGKAYVSQVELTLDAEGASPVKIGDNYTNSGTTVKENFPWSTNVVLKKYTASDMTLTKGTHTITVSVAVPTASTQPYLFALDYIQFTPKTDTITQTAPKKVEFETMTTSDIAELPAASGGKYVKNTWKSAKPVIEKEIKIADSGYYEIEYVVGSKDNGGNYVSKVDLYLDDALLGSNTDTSTEDLYSEVGFSWASGKMKKYNKAGIWLEADTYTLSADVGLTADSLYKFQMDYIRFAPCTETVSADASATIEIEEYVQDKAANVVAVEKASGGSVAYRDYSESVGLTVNIPVIIEETGWYGLEYVASDRNRTSSPNGYSKVTFTLGDKLIASTATDTVLENIPESDIKLSNAPAASKFGARAYLVEGTYTLTVDVTKEWGVYRALVDYIKFTAETEELSKSKATTIELSDYSTKSDVVKTEADGENKIICTTWSYDSRTEAYTILKVEESGYYDIEYISNAPRGGSYGAARFYIDDEEIASAHKDTGIDVSDYTLWTATAVKKYTKEKVYIEEGTYTLKFEFTPDGGANYRGLADYIKFAPSVEEGFKIENSVATANVCYDTPVTGTVILALYNGDKFVGMGTKVANGEKNITVTAEVKGTVTHAKVFVWKDLTSVKPLVAPKEFPNN